MKNTRIAIFDYMVGNVGSLKSRLEHEGFLNVIVTNDLSVLCSVDCIILPGVGSFGHCVNVLIEKKASHDFFKKFLNGKDKLLIGICIGMHLLGDCSEEGPSFDGLGLIPGTIKRIKVSDNEKLPHVGWNTVQGKLIDPNYFDGDVDLYFDHSYRFNCNAQYVGASTFYGEDIPAIIESNNIVGFQFHPELSGKLGLNILSKFIQRGMKC